jgi:hypothetical protein
MQPPAFSGELAASDGSWLARSHEQADADHQAGRNAG